MKFPIKFRYISKIEKKNSIALVFLVMQIRRNIQSMSKWRCDDKHVDLLLIKEGCKKN